MGAPRINDRVAITGYSHRMPGGIRSDSDFWRLLSEREIVQEPISGRYGRGHLPIGEFSGPGRLASPYEGLIRDEDELLFDRTFFGMSHNELRQTEPQVRMLLNCAWEAIEHAGWNLHALRNSPTGAFVGSQVPAVSNWRPQHGVSEYSVSGISLAMLANRVSYHFNLIGSSATYCMACSAGLSALHAAMNALECGDCDQALVGAVTYLGSARMSSGFNLMGVISPEGMCHSFDAGANGYMRAEGSFVFAIKPLAAAERDGDPIYAVIKATAINAAGAADGTAGLAPGRFISAPTGHSQVALMREACARADRPARDFDYIEAHSAGTAVGDPIEGNAIAEAFGDSGREGPLRVSSVKSNVGHMEAAAFHCTLLKVVLMMQRRTFAPTSKSFQVPNPEIDFDSCPMQVQTACEPFPEHPVVVGINSFGFGGVNGHCVVREYRPAQRRLWSVSLAPDAGFMIPLSARTPRALAESARLLHGMLEAQEVDLYTLAGNLSRRRTHFAARTAFAVQSVQELTEVLDTSAEEGASTTTAEEGERRLVMVFAGQGTQWAGCGRDLYAAHPVFRRAVDAIEGYWQEYAETSLREACFEAPQEELDEVQLAQPAIFMIQCALVELFKTWGGVSRLRGGAQLRRGRRGLRLGRALARRRDAPGVPPRHSAATRGGVGSYAGDRPRPSRRGGTAGRPGRSLPPRRKPARPGGDRLRERAGQYRHLRPRARPAARDGGAGSTQPSEPADPGKHRLPFAGNGRHRGRCAGGALLPRQSRLRRRRALRLVGDGYRDGEAGQRLLVVEHSPAGPFRRCGGDGHARPQARRGAGARAALGPAALIAQYMEDASSPPFPSRHSCGTRTRASAFTRPWALSSRPACRWISRPSTRGLSPSFICCPGIRGTSRRPSTTRWTTSSSCTRGEYAHGPLVGHRIPSDHLLFEARLSERAFPWLADHRVHHASIMPAAGYIELTLQALGGVPVHFDVLEFLQPCPIPKTPVRLQTALYSVPNSSGEYSFRISTLPYEVDAKSELHCRGNVRLIDARPELDAPETLADIDTSRYEALRYAADDEIYERFEVVLRDTFQYGPNFRNIRRLRRELESGRLLLDVGVDEELWAAGKGEGYVSFPPLLDGGLQSFLYDLMLGADRFAISLRAENVTFLGTPTVPRLVCQLTYPGGKRYEVDDKGQYDVPNGEWVSGRLNFYDDATGALTLHVEKYVSFISYPRRDDLSHSKHRISWQPKFVADGRAIADRLPEGEIEPSTLIAALERGEGGDARACHVLEFAGAREPDQTMLQRRVDHLSRDSAQSEFWLVADDEEAARACFDAFHGRGAALRFDCLGPAARESSALDTGLLRRHAAELLLLHGEGDAFTPEDWRFWQEVTVVGGLEEPLSSFGLNSISVAELGAFIQSEFNFQASAPELMTTASCHSLAHAIVFGAKSDDEAEAEGEGGGVETAPLVAERRVRRRPSTFASPPEDHFPPAPCSGRGAAQAKPIR